MAKIEKNLQPPSSMDEVWSGNRESIGDRLSYFICNDFLSDMTFVVGEEKIKVPGHRFILSTCSWDFYNALYLLKVDNDELPIEDVSYETFLCFLEYCYTGTLSLSSEKCIDILKLAHRFSMKHLAKLCDSYIDDVLSAKTCMQLYKQCSYLPEDSKMKLRILDTIGENFFCLIRNKESMDTWRDLSLNAVRKITSLERLQCDEKDLFDVLMQWAVNRCKKDKIAPLPKNLRECLDDVFYKIRFPTMKIEWFLEILESYPDMFSGVEISRISGIIRGQMMTSEKFSTKKRDYDRKTVKSSMNLIDLGGVGNLFPCFTTLKITEDSASSFSIKIEADENKFILGIGVISQIGQKIKVKSCKIQKVRFIENEFGFEEFCTDSDNRLIERHCTNIRSYIAQSSYPLNSDYEIILIKFYSIVIINPGSCYELFCDFDTDLPHLCLGLPSKISSQQLNISKGRHAILPYLHVTES